MDGRRYLHGDHAGVSTLDLLPWAIQCYAAVVFALIYGFTGFGIAKLQPQNDLQRKEA